MRRPLALVFVLTGTLLVALFATAAVVAQQPTASEPSELAPVADQLLVPALAHTKTVGIDPASCATSDAISVAAGTTVIYCYEVVNTGTVTFALHDLVDSELGIILDDFAFSLAPGASVFLTQSATITATTVNSATWTAFNAGPVDVTSASDSATVTVVGPEPLVCNGAAVTFDAGIPSDWTVVNNASGNPVAWTDIAGCGEAGNFTGGAGGAACASSDLQGGGSGLYDTELWSNPIDLSAGGPVTLDYVANYQNFALVDILDLDVSTDGGATWSNALSWNEDHGTFRNVPGEAVSVDLTPYTGNPSVLLRWRYYDPNGPVTSQDWYAQLDEVSLSCVSGPGITLAKTVGTDPASCATSDAISVAAGTEVTYCYEVTNSGTISLTLHDLVDSELGIILDDFAFALAPGASVFLTQSATINATTVNSATWTAFNPGPVDSVSASDSATVTIAAAEPLVCNGAAVTFDAGIPSDWTVINNASGNPVVWTDIAGCGEAGNFTGGTGGAACASSDLQGGGSGLYDTELRSNPIDLSAGGQVTLDYRANYQNFASVDNLDLDVSTDGGATWSNLLNWNEDHPSGGLRAPPGEAVSVDLSAFNGQSDVRLRWRYYDPNGPATSTDWYAQLDEVSLSCVSGPGITLAKTVGTDPATCATSDAISVAAGTEVTYCYEVTNSGTISLTLHDLVDSELGIILDDFAFALAPGASVFLTQSATINVTTVNSATWTAFNPGPVDSVSASDSATVTILGSAPQIGVTPSAISETLPPGGSATRAMTITNGGAADLTWTIVETTNRAGPGLEPGIGVPSPVQPAQPVAPPEPVSSPAECGRYENFLGPEPPGWAEHCLGELPSVTPAAATPLDPTDIGFAQDIGFVSDNFVSFTLNDFPGQTVLGSNAAALFGYDFNAAATTLYAINNDTDQLGTIDLATGAFSAIGSSVPATGHSWTGLTIDPQSDTFYASSSDGAVSLLYTLNPATGAATTIGTITAAPLVIDIAMGPNGDLIAHDISTDSVYDVDPATGAATVIGTTGFDANFAQGMDFDNADGTLYIFLYQGGGANIYGTVDLVTGSVTPLAVSNPQGEFEGATQTVAGGSGGCSANDLPWASVAPTSGTTSAGASSTVNVTFDATGLAPGSYTGSLCISSNDPATPQVDVPLTLTVAGAPPPSDITLNKTVGLAPGLCATTDSVTIMPNDSVTYCFTVTNTGTNTYTTHDLVDSELGTILSGAPLTLGPGGSIILIQSATLTQTTISTATWTASAAGVSPAAASDSTEVIVEPPTAIELGSLTSTPARDPIRLAALLLVALVPLAIAIRARRRLT